MAHGEERGLRVRADRVEEPERGLLPRRVLEDALGPRRDPVVRARVDVAGAARCRGTACGGLRGPRGGHPTGARRTRGLGPCSPASSSAPIASHERVEDGVHERVVPEVRPAVVHVEHGDVDRPRVLRREVLRPLDAHVLEHPARGARRAVRLAELPAVLLLEAADEGHGPGKSIGRSPARPPRLGAMPASRRVPARSRDSRACRAARGVRLGAVPLREEVRWS